MPSKYAQPWQFSKTRLHTAVMRCPALLLFLLLAACATPQIASRQSGQDLQIWSIQVLAPYLAKQLGEHPRFKGEPVLLVAMQGDNVKTEIDQLTASIREQVFDNLLQSSQANLVWRPSTMHLQHHTRLTELQCHPAQTVRYQIGFDIKPQGTLHQLSVKVLDLQEGRWVAGFGKSWQGKLTTHQLASLKQLHSDEFLRGLRPLPFSEQQLDLTALYLAHNLSCVLKQRKLEQIFLYVQPSASMPSYLQKTLHLMGNYLARFHEITLVKSLPAANVLLQGELLNIHTDLYQLWAVATLTQTGERLKGADADAYVRLSSAMAIPPVLKPPTTRKADIISEFTLIKPASNRFCASPAPWSKGLRTIAVGMEINSCFGIALTVRNNTTLFLLNESTNGAWQRFLPESANALEMFTLTAKQRFRYPAGQVFELEKNARDEWIHAIAVTDPSLSRQLAQMLASMPVCCSAPVKSTYGYWRTKLEGFKKQHETHMDWRTIRVRYDH